MAKLHEWLKKEHKSLVDAATKALTSRSDADATIKPAIEVFYEALVESVEKVEPETLNNVLRDWVVERSGPVDDKTERFTPVLNALCIVTRDQIVDKASPSEAASLLLLFNRAMDSALEYLVEQEVEAATRDMTAELKKVRRDVKKLDKHKADFISVAAHELKTPLTLIEGYANMLREEFPSEEHPRAGLMLGGISNGTSRLRAIINDMIDVSMIDMEMLELHFQPVWLNRLVDIVVDELKPEAEIRKQKIIVGEIEKADKPVFADPERLQQVMRNILVNAIKFTPDDGEIQIRVKSLPEFYDVQVEDNGIGIPKEELTRIFERFTQLGEVALHSSSKINFKGGGPGLGLAIVRGIMEAHGGSVWAESPGYDEKECPGSTFHIMVPIRSDRAMETSQDIAMEKLFDVTRDAGKDRKPDSQKTKGK